MRKKVDLVLGARPNFIKLAPLYRELSQNSLVDCRLIFTGQHTHESMSWSLLEDLELPAPHVQFQLHADSHATQTASVMIQYERHCLQNRPDLTIVVGDVNSSLGACLAAKKLGIAVGHAEAGLRCGDLRLPEELNRRLIDSISDALWAPSEEAVLNLVAEGKQAQTLFAGNLLIDSLVWALNQPTEVAPAVSQFLTAERPFVLVTLHRDHNVDSPDLLSQIVEQLLSIAESLDVCFPVHPRTQSRLQSFQLWEKLQQARGIYLLEPVLYTQFVRLLSRCRCVITDSGGIQEECAYLGIRNLTVRSTTERPVTLSATQQLVEISSINCKLHDLLQVPASSTRAIAGWDGKAAIRIAQHVLAITKTRCINPEEVLNAAKEASLSAPQPLL